MLYATGTHLLKEYGYTLKEIEKDGFIIDRIIDMKIKSKNNLYDMAISTGEGVQLFADAFHIDMPDIVIVFGDRIEPLSAAIAASIMNIPVAHIGGGDGGFSDIDNTLRHAITKLSHLHFTNSKKSMECVLQLGEERWRVHSIGALSLDALHNKKLYSKKKILSKYNIPYKDYLLIIYHPVTTEWKDASNQAKQCFQASIEIAREYNLNIIVIYPNAYIGGYDIIGVIKKYKEIYDNFYSFENLPHTDYLSILDNALALVGNSSSGILETPSLHIPTINIGTRQSLREKAENVIDVEYDKEKIKSAIRKAIVDEEFRSIVKNCFNPYGNGKASNKIIKILESIKINNKLLQKKMIHKTEDYESFSDCSTS